jgi:hypothetical protein
MDSINKKLKQNLGGFFMGKVKTEAKHLTIGSFINSDDNLQKKTHTSPTLPLSPNPFS